MVTSGKSFQRQCASQKLTSVSAVGSADLPILQDVIPRCSETSRSKASRPQDCPRMHLNPSSSSIAPVASRATAAFFTHTTIMGYETCMEWKTLHHQGGAPQTQADAPAPPLKPKRILLFGLSLACPGQRSNDSLTCSSKWEHFCQPPAGTRRSISQPTALASKRVRLSPEACRYTTVRLRILTPRMTPQPTMQTTQKTARIPQLVRRWGNEYSNMAS